MTALETYSDPEKEAQLKTSFVRYLFSNLACKFLCKISYMKELLPEPETPVIATNLPNGTSAVRFFILKIFPPAIFNEPFCESRLFSGIAIFISPRRYARVLDFDLFFGADTNLSHWSAPLTSPP